MESQTRITYKKSCLFLIMTMMMVKCKQCGFEHPSALQMDEDSFEASIISNNSENCTKCGHSSDYNKEDYFFQ